MDEEVHVGAFPPGCTWRLAQTLLVAVAMLCEMFPNLPEEILSSVWFSCEKNFAAAVDEALTVASLGNDRVQNNSAARSEVPLELWEDPPSSGEAVAVMRRAAPERPRKKLPEDSVRNLFVDAPPFDPNPAIGNPDLKNPFIDDVEQGGASDFSTLEQQQQPLPWESKAGYVIGQGELGLLNELQLPRRGSIVPLPPDFLRIPSSLSREDTLSERSGARNAVLLPNISPLQSSIDAQNLVEETEGPDLIVFDERRAKSGGDNDRSSEAEPRKEGSGSSSKNDGADPVKRTRVNPDLAPLTPSPAKLVPLRDPHLQGETASVDEVRRKSSRWGRGNNNEEEQEEEKRPQEAVVAALTAGKGTLNVNRKDVRAEEGTGFFCGNMNGMDSFRANNIDSMQEFREVLAARRHVETASSADRIAAFPPGTRFRVAVDKGVTGLGITVKEIQGRFVVYRLQMLADGSPGAAQEAGVQAGDELLGVEELDFETERWDIDQLVSYMRELVGVVILYIMRGTGPLARAPAGDEEAGMSHGVAQTDGGADSRDNSSTRSRGSGVSSPARKARVSAKRLLEVLDEEELLNDSSEASDLTRLYCQISDRARQWDTGELWRSVAGLARRPSPGAVAAFANRWQPGEPPGWDESDSSDEGGDSQFSANTPRDHDDVKGRDDAVASSAGRNFDEEDGPVDLDTIGTALLGQPLFNDTVAAVAAASGESPPIAPPKIGGSGSLNTSASSAENTVYGGNNQWSPWPQLAALENKAARRDTVVPTQGLRKALNVRVLGQVAQPVSGGAPNDKINGKKNGGKGKDDNLSLQSTPYLVWVMDVESGAEWRVRRTHAEFAELWEVCTGMRPSLARLDFPSCLPDVAETPGMVEARRPRLEGYLQRLCSILYMGPLHPSSAHVAHLLQDFLGTTPRVETLARLQRSRPERELRQALQVRAWQVLRLPPLERAVANFVAEITDAPVAPSKKAVSAETILKKITEIMERLQYVVTEGCFDELREMVRASTAPNSVSDLLAGEGEHREGTRSTGTTPTDVPEFRPLRGGSAADADADAQGIGEKTGGGAGEKEAKSDAHSFEDMAVEDEALELISGSVRRQVEAEVFVPVMGRLYKLLRTEGATARSEKIVASAMEEAQGKPQSFHGIPLRSLSPSSWGSAARLLKAVGSFTLPSDKLDALVAVAHAIPALYRAEHPGDESRQLGADDFLPIFIYVLVNSGVEGVASLSVILDTLCDPKKMIGEAGFCVATLSAALQHLERSAAEQTSKKGRSSSILGRRSK